MLWYAQYPTALLPVSKEKPDRNLLDRAFGIRPLLWAVMAVVPVVSQRELFSSNWLDATAAINCGI